MERSEQPTSFYLGAVEQLGTVQWVTFDDPSLDGRLKRYQRGCRNRIDCSIERVHTKSGINYKRMFSDS